MEWENPVGPTAVAAFVASKALSDLADVTIVTTIGVVSAVVGAMLGTVVCDHFLLAWALVRMRASFFSIATYRAYGH